MKKTFLATLLLLFSNSGISGWSETSVSLLRGNNFAELFGSDNNKTELSIEHASGHKYGDNFIWVDVTNPLSDNSDSNFEVYGEWSPRVSLGNIFAFYDKSRFIQDFLLSGTLEFGRDSSVQTQSKLYGIALDFNIPHFAFFQYNFYVRDNINKSGTTFQSTFAYKLPIQINDKLNFSYSAYIDIVHGEEGSGASLAEAHWHTGQQFLMDISSLWSQKNIIHVGFEYQYWNRKYGIKGGPVENNLKYMVKWVF